MVASSSEMNLKDGFWRGKFQRLFTNKKNALMISVHLIWDGFILCFWPSEQQQHWTCEKNDRVPAAMNASSRNNRSKYVDEIAKTHVSTMKTLDEAVSIDVHFQSVSPPNKIAFDLFLCCYRKSFSRFDDVYVIWMCKMQLNSNVSVWVRWSQS